MKQTLIIIGFLTIFTQLALGQNEICENCVEYTLELKGYLLQGSSHQFAGNLVSMILPSDFSEDSLNLGYLFRKIQYNEVVGEFVSKNNKISKIKYSIVPYQDRTTVFMKTPNGWYPWDKIKIENNQLMFSYDYWYCPPATKTDMEVLDLCVIYLNNSTSWHQNDDRKCDNDRLDKVWSLFCAIKSASIEKYGEYNHRGYVVQTARFVINELYPNRGYTHTLMDFNNDSSTKFEDILKILTIIKERVQEDLITGEK